MKSMASQQEVCRQGISIIRTGQRDSKFDFVATLLC